MPSRPIQVIPPGLLGFLQLKSGGQNPVELLDGYSPILDLTKWILQATAEFTTGTVALATGSGVGNFGTPITVPNEEWWYVHAFTISASLVAGDTINELAPCVSYLPIPIHSSIGTTLSFAKVGANNQAVASARDFFVPPGASLRFFYGLVSAGNITFDGNVRFSRLPA